MKIVIIGPYPPPFGGISIHIKRMRMYLLKKGEDVCIYNEIKNSKNTPDNIYPTGSFKKFIFKIPFIKGDVFHFHSIDIRVRMIIGIYKLFNKKIMLTIHGESLNQQLENSNLITKKILLKSLKSIDKIVCVNKNIQNRLINLGINKESLICIPAFITPIEDVNDEKNISQEIWDFIKNSEFLICANGCIRLENNEDIYGIDMLIELISKIKDCSVKLIIALLGVKNQSLEEKECYKGLKSKIESLRLKDRIIIYETEHTEFYPILKMSKLFIRPTNQDGDAISVRESIHLNIPAIASDAAYRPKGTILFKKRDIDDLYKKTMYVVENYNTCKVNLKKIHIEDNAEALYKVYEKLSNI